MMESMTGSSPESAAGDEGERSFLFTPGSFCMDRLTLPPVTVALEQQDEQGVGKEVEEAVMADMARNDTTPVLEEDDEDVHYVILLCPCSARGVRCVRKCCHANSVLRVDDKGDTECQHDPQQQHDEEDGVASAADFNRARAAQAAREWGPSQHRHPDELHSGECGSRTASWRQIRNARSCGTVAFVSLSAGQELFMLHALPHCSNPEGRRFLLNDVTLFNSSQSGQFWIMDDGKPGPGPGESPRLPPGPSLIVFCGLRRLRHGGQLRRGQQRARGGLLRRGGAARGDGAARRQPAGVRRPRRPVRLVHGEDLLRRPGRHGGGVPGRHAAGARHPARAAQEPPFQQPDGAHGLAAHGLHRLDGERVGRPVAATLRLPRSGYEPCLILVYYC